MKFGLMYEIQIPEPHHPGIEAERYKQVLAQVDLADEVGFEYFWTVEHHFLREFSHCSAPEVLYGAISQRTKRIRIGHAVALLPSQYNHPVRVAERAAVLDILSDGRMDLGTGRSTTLIEMDGFEVDPAQTQAQWNEAIQNDSQDVDGRPLLSTRASSSTSPSGRSSPSRCRSRTRPCGLPAASPTASAAPASMGLGVLCFNLGGYAQMEERVAAYREAVKNANPVGSFVNDQVAALCIVHCGEDGEEARRVGGPEGAWFVQMAENLYAPWAGREVPDSYKFAVDAIQTERVDKTAQDHLESGAFAMGTPDEIIEVMKKYQEAGVDQVLCFVQPGNLPHTRIMDSIKLMGKHVIPYFK